MGAAMRPKTSMKTTSTGYVQPNLFFELKRSHKTAPPAARTGTNEAIRSARFDCAWIIMASMSRKVMLIHLYCARSFPMKNHTSPAIQRIDVKIPLRRIWSRNIFTGEVVTFFIS